MNPSPVAFHENLTLTGKNSFKFRPSASFVASNNRPYLSIPVLGTLVAFSHSGKVGRGVPEPDEVNDQAALAISAQRSSPAFINIQDSNVAIVCGSFQRSPEKGVV